MDIVGTGGDGKNTFNISTLACFIVAGAGQKVAKHGNYGASTISGASNVMESLGYKFKNRQQCLKKGSGRSQYLFYACAAVSPGIKNGRWHRKALGVRTFFNMLGLW